MGIATVLQHFRATSYISSEIATRIFCPLWFALQLFTFIVSFKQRFKQWSYFISNIIVHELQDAYITLRVIDRGALQTRQSKSDHFAIWVWWLFSKHFHRFLEFLHLQTKYLLQLCQWPLTALTLANLEFSLKARLYFLCLLVSTLVLGAKKIAWFRCASLLCDCVDSSGENIYSNAPTEHAPPGGGLEGDFKEV